MGRELAGKKVFDFKVFDKFVVAATNGSSWSVAADDNNNSDRNSSNNNNNNNQRKQLRGRRRVKERSQSCLKVSLQIEWEGRKSHQKHI